MQTVPRSVEELATASVDSDTPGIGGGSVNVCVCPLGLEATDPSVCDVNGATRCESCNTGYTHVNST